MELKDDYELSDVLARNAAYEAGDDDNEWFADDWEDSVAIAKLREQHPGWLFMKIVGYTPHKFTQIEEWCRDNCQHKYKKINWSSGCAMTVAVAFEHFTDAIIYKLAWQ